MSLSVYAAYKISRYFNQQHEIIDVKNNKFISYIFSMVVSSTMICIIVVVQNFAVEPRHICCEDASTKICCRQCETIDLCVLPSFPNLKP